MSYEKEYQILGLQCERSFSHINYEHSIELIHGKWYHSILDGKLKYGKYNKGTDDFIDVDGKFFKVSKGDILTGSVFPIKSCMSIVGTNIVKFNESN
jgi:hypothetical protein